MLARMQRRHLTDGKPMSAVDEQFRHAKASLSTTEPFRLGSILVEPAARSLTIAGESRLIEPRVMRVLVALARAPGETLDRDMLIEQCWDGRAVTDDAIQRCVAQLRRIAAQAPQSFEIETIRGVGYRLKKLVEPAPSSQDGGRGGKRVGARYAAMAVPGVAMLAAAIFFWPAGKKWTVEGASPLLTSPAIERHVSFDPGGNFIAYASGENIRSRDIYIRGVAGGEPIRVTQTPGDESSPVWSPTGDRLAFVSRPSRGPCHIEMMTPPRGIATETGRCKTADYTRIAWAPDGRALYFSDRDAVGEPLKIFRLDLATGAAIAVSAPPAAGEDSEPQLSPDGENLLYVRSVKGTVSYVIRNLKTQTERTLLSGTEWRLSAAWLSDGKAIVAPKKVGDGTALMVVPLDGGAPYIATYSPDSIGRISGGPNGYLSVEVTRTQFEIIAGAEGAQNPPQQIDEADGITLAPEFASDGAVALASTRGGSPGVWIAEPRQSPRLLAPIDNLFGFRLKWSHDARRLALLGVSRNGLTLTIVGRDGDGSRSFVLDGLEAGSLDWTPDDDAIVFSRRDQTGWRLMRMQLRDGRAAELSAYGWSAAWFDGGELIASRDNVAGLWRFDERGPVQVNPLLPPPAHTHDWRIYRGEIFFQKDSREGVVKIAAAPISGGEAREVASAKMEGGGLERWSINPVNGSIAFNPSIFVNTDVVLYRMEKK